VTKYNRCIGCGEVIAIEGQSRGRFRLCWECVNDGARLERRPGHIAYVPWIGDEERAAVRKADIERQPHDVKG